MRSHTKRTLSIASAALLTSQMAGFAFTFGGAAATDVENWTTNNVAFVQGTADGFTLDWENVLTNTAAANVANNSFDVVFESNTNYTIGHIYLFNEMLDLATVPGGIQQMTWPVDFEASDKTNWIPVIVVTDGGVTNFYRSNNTGNSWNGNNALTFTAGAVDNTYWVGLNGDPIGGINDSRVDGFHPDLQAETGLVQFGFIQWDASTGGIISPAAEFSTAIERFELTINEVELPSAQLDSSAFNTLYDATDIFDGTQLINDWAEPGAAGTDVELGLDESETNLTITNADNNGWIELNNGGTTWENGVADGGSWTAEVRLRLAPDIGNAFVIWAANGIERGIMQIDTNAVSPFGLAPIDDNDNTDDFHTFRMAYDADIGLYFFWRDGVLLNPDGGVAAQAATGQNRFIIGDCCSSYLMTVADVQYVRFDTEGAYAPGPTTPAAITDISISEDNMVTLTWTSTPGVTYAVDESPDLSDWSIEVDDGSVATEETTSLTFEGPPPGTKDVFYRVRVAD